MQNLSITRNRSIIVLILFLGLSIGFMFLNVKITTFSVRNIFFFITYPIQYSFTAVGKFFVNTATSIARIQQLEEELKTTKERLLRYQENLLLTSQIEKENDDLRRVLSIRSNVTHTSMYARVVFRDPNLTGDYYVIDKGILDGVRNDMPVMAYGDEGEVYLIGRTIEANLTACKVKLVTAADSYIGVTLKTSGYIGILRGFGSWNQNSVVDYIPIEANAFVGEDIVTSGESDVFPAGLQIGKIVGIGKSNPEDFFKKIYAKPDIKYTKIRDVFIIDWKPAAETSTLNKRTGVQ
jgi:rod shape-determining protein MreC